MSIEKQLDALNCYLYNTTRQSTTNYCINSNYANESIITIVLFLGLGILGALLLYLLYWLLKKYRKKQQKVRNSVYRPSSGYSLAQRRLDLVGSEDGEVYFKSTSGPMKPKKKRKPFRKRIKATLTDLMIYFDIYKFYSRASWISYSYADHIDKSMDRRGHSEMTA